MKISLCRAAVLLALLMNFAPAGAEETVMRYRGKEEAQGRFAELTLTFRGIEFLGKAVIYSPGVRGTLFTSRIYFRGRTPGAWEDEKTVLAASSCTEEYDDTGQAKADVPAPGKVTITLGKGLVRLENRRQALQTLLFSPSGGSFKPDLESPDQASPDLESPGSAYLPAAGALDLTGDWNVIITNREMGPLHATLSLVQEGTSVRGTFPPMGETISAAVTGTFDGKKLKLERAVADDTVQRYELTFERYALAGRYRNWGIHKDSGAIRMVRR